MHTHTHSHMHTHTHSHTHTQTHTHSPLVMHINKSLSFLELVTLALTNYKRGAYLTSSPNSPTSSMTLQVYRHVHVLHQ